jgi:hypothetical protein
MAVDPFGSGRNGGGQHHSGEEEVFQSFHSFDLLFVFLSVQRTSPATSQTLVGFLQLF